MTDRRASEGPEPDPAVLDAREEAALVASVRPVGSRGRGVTLAAVLIVVAFVIGLARPWDWLAAAPAGDASPVASTVPGDATPNPGDDGQGGVSPIGSNIPDTDQPEPTCGYPTDWRSATIQTWAGRRARVWTAVEVAQASGPTDPAIPFQVVAGDDFTAIGWCAPVSGDERPPAAAHGRLYRIEGDGTAVELVYTRLEPRASSSLGELWVPAEEPMTSDRGWPVGRYVILLEADDGRWDRWLGLDLRTAPPVASPAVTPSPTATPSAAAPGEPSPEASPG